MQPVTPRTTVMEGAMRSSGLGLRSRGLDLFLDLPRDRVGQDLLDGDPRGLPGLRLHPGLGPVLDLLGPLRGHGDEPELAVYVPWQDQVRHQVMSPLWRGRYPGRP